MVRKLLIFIFFFTYSLSAIEKTPLFLDAPKKTWSTRTQCVIPIANNTQFVRVLKKSIEILNERDLSVDKTLPIRWKTNKATCLLSEDEKYLFLSTYYNIQMYDIQTLKLYKTFPFEYKSTDINGNSKDDAIRDFSFAPHENILNILSSSNRLYRLDIQQSKYKKIADKLDSSNSNSTIKLEKNKLIVYNYQNTKKPYSFDIDTKKISEYSNKSKRRILCTNEEGTRYVKKTKTSYDVYDETSNQALLKLTKQNRRDKNSKGIIANSCLLYDDTLLIVGESLQKINLINKEISYSKNFYPLKTLPLMVWAENDNYIISHHVSAFYGWEKKTGKQIWKNVGPFLNRNHWDQADLSMAMYKHKAIARPYGWSGDYINGIYEQNIYWAFNIQDGTYVFTPLTKLPEKSSFNRTHSYLSKGEQKYFTLNDVKFINLENSEWLVLSKEGYFNASSINVLRNIYIKENSNKRKLNKKELSKWYRPDIIASILQKKDFERLKHIKHNFKLPMHSKIKNQYRNSLVREYMENKNSDALLKLGYLRDISTLPFLFEILEKVNMQKEYSIVYNALKNYSYDSIKDMLSNRINQINKKSAEQSELIRFLYAKNQGLAKSLISDFIKKGILTNASRKVIAQNITKYRFNNRKLNEKELNIAWEVWEKQNYIANEYILNICSKHDISQAQANAISTLIYLHNNPKKIASPWCPGWKDSSRIESTIEGSISSMQLMLYKYLYDTKANTKIDKLKETTNKQINRFLRLDEFCIYGIKELLKLQIKYNNKKENKILFQKLKNYVEIDTFKNKWIKYSEDQRSRKIIDIVKILDEYDSVYVDNLIIRLKEANAQNHYYQEWTWMIIKRYNF